jgi:CRISPR type III-B/RAMP module-associated protein Cmr3
MSTWIIEPRDPLIVGDGRPFGPNPGARATSLSFPFPSTLIGALRSRAGSDEHGHFTADPKTVLKYEMRGPLLVELDDVGKIKECYLPAPADALIYTDSNSQTIRRVWLAPQEDRNSSISNQPDDLWYIGPKERVKGKAYSDAPSFWSADDFAQWLSQPKDSPSDSDEDFAFANPSIKSLHKDTRMHVSINKDTQTGEDGLLYLTSGLEFVRVEKQEDDEYRKTFHRLALAVDFKHNIERFEGGLAPLGGERRLMHWQKSESSLELFFEGCKAKIIEQICNDKRARVILLTPAYFTNGFRPEMQWTFAGVTATLKGVVNSRYQTVSGWDFASNRPKASTRLAPAGSVYYVEFAEGTDIAAWCEAVWLQNVSDGEQWRRDGFGLAVLGIWKEE